MRNKIILVNVILLLFCEKQLCKQMIELKYFNSAEEAVQITKQLITEEDWKELGKYYHLEKSQFSYDDATEKKFYKREIPLEIHHPTDDPYIIRPFDPSYEFSHVEKNEDIITVWLKKEIDQGEGKVQIGLQSFQLINKKEGLQLIP